MSIKIKFQKIHPQAIIPKKMTPGSAGYDIYSLEDVSIKPGEVIFIRTGIALELPEGYFVMVAPRGSLCIKKHLDMPHSIGIGDEDYRGEYLIVYRNIGTETVLLEKNERIAQFIFVKYADVEFEEADSLEPTERGDGGFGSTGKK